MVTSNSVLLRLPVPRRSLGLWICLGISLGGITHLRADEIDFESTISPIFASSCLKCHGPDEPAAELDLTSPESVADLEILKKDSDGEVVITKLNQNILQNIAASTGGIYQDGNNTQKVLDFVSEQLKAMDKKEFEAKKFVSFKDRFQAFLLAALIFWHKIEKILSI